ncbi:MAG: glycosyltransferase [Planctomycetaceae bacterium]|nr:glycosyltransferase [Planctomycetaceae bacterium]
MNVLVMTSMYPTPENPAFGSFVKTQVDALRAEGVDVELLVLRGRNRKWMYIDGLKQMRNRLRKGGIDVVHAHFSYVGVIARMQRMAPVVVTYHGDDLLGCVADQTGRHSQFSRFMVRVGQRLGRCVDAAIVQTAEMAAKLDHASHVHIVPHEVDFDTFRVVDRLEARQELGLDPDKPLVLFAANPQTQVKRFPLAQEAVARVQRDWPEVELLVIYREPQARLALYMNACDALIFPSFQEGSPNVVKQAMACNLPIVATDVGDVREVIESTEGCAVCRPDADEMARELQAILARRQRTRGLDAVQRFDRAAVVEQLLGVYRNAIGREETGRHSDRRAQAAVAGVH